MSQNLSGKVALVTGAGSGIGRGVALALAQAGVRVAVCGRRLEKLKETVAGIRQAAGDDLGLAIQADVSNEADVARLVQAAQEAFGRLDFVINNAGVFEGGRLDQIEPAAWDRVMDINLRGPYLLTRAVLPIFRAQRSGHIINISSESGLNYYADDGVYGTSKHALNALGEYTQRENQDLNIKVNTICPGMVVSEMSVGEPGLNLEKCLTPEDIADLVIWLLTRRPNVKIGTPILIQTMENPWE